MSEIFEEIQSLIERNEVRISAHGYNELIRDGIMAMDALEGISEATLLENYPDYPKGPCVLVLQKDRQGEPIHVVWGISKGKSSPAVLVTAYRPDPDRWTADFKRRKK